jgi:hypothetical protein
MITDSGTTDPWPLKPAWESLTTRMVWKYLPQDTYKTEQSSWVWWSTPVIPSLRRRRKEDREFQLHGKTSPPKEGRGITWTTFLTWGNTTNNETMQHRVSPGLSTNKSQHFQGTRPTVSAHERAQNHTTWDQARLLLYKRQDPCSQHPTRGFTLLKMTGVAQFTRSVLWKE